MLYLFVFTKFRTQNRFALLLELLYVRQENSYLRKRSPAAARAFAQSMKRARLLLQDFPDAGNSMRGLQLAGFRTRVVDDYLLDYP